MILFRVIKRSRPNLSDFWSDLALGNDPLPDQLREPLLWAGVSMFADLQLTITNTRAYSLGRAVARLDIPDEADVILRPTAGRGHFSVVGTPHRLKSLVSGDAIEITASA